MSRGLTDYARLYLADKAGFLTRLTAPVLLWEARSELSPADEQWNRTESGVRAVRPRAAEPVAFELVKAEGKKNPFAMGVTVGRIETNDIVIDDASISRFHAYFQSDPRSKGWLLVDAESKNGSFLDGTRLVANQKHPIADGSRVCFGDVELSFLLPSSLLAHIAAGLE